MRNLQTVGQTFLGLRFRLLLLMCYLHTADYFDASRAGEDRAGDVVLAATAARMMQSAAAKKKLMGETRQLLIAMADPGRSVRAIGAQQETGGQL